MADQVREAVAQRLRDKCEILRMRPIPLNHLIPLMQEAADALDDATASHAAEVEALRSALAELDTKCDVSDDCQYGTLSTNYVREVCRAALKGDKP